MKRKLKNIIVLSGFITCLAVLGLINFGFKDLEEDDKPITLKEYNKITANKDTIVLVYFHASWCMVCAKVKPVIETIEKEYKGKVKVLRIDTDRDKEITQEFEIDALPVLMLYKKGNRQWIFPGIIDANSLRAKLDAQLQ
ncbi:MAG: thioredoxin family protein [Bacteroidia bacterium]